MIDLILYAYLAMSFITVGAYIPTIIKMKSTESTDSSVVGWLIWFSSSAIGVLYAGLVIDALPLLVLNFGHLLGTGFILLIQIRKKNEMKTLLG